MGGIGNLLPLPVLTRLMFLPGVGFWSPWFEACTWLLPEALTVQMTKALSWCCVWWSPAWLPAVCLH